MRILYVKPNALETDAVTKALEGHEVFFTENIETVDEENLKSVEVLSVFVDVAVNEEILNKLPNLKFIATRSVGFDHIDIKSAQARGIIISRVPHYGSQTVAEFVFALMFALSRNAFQAYVDLMADPSVDSLEPYEGFDLAGKTLGVIGTGKIGQRVCEVAKSFGMNVVAYDQYENNDLISLGISYKSIDELMKESDIVTIHVPSLPTTFHLINSQFLSLMKTSAYLINTARGEVVDTEALVEALLNKKIAGAALDVLEGERTLATEDSLSDKQKNDAGLMRQLSLNHQLINMQNVIVTPHIAFNTREAKQEITDITVANIIQYSQGTPQNIVSV